MEQYVQENVLPVALFLVWFAFTCVNANYHKKVLYAAEFIALLVGIITDVCWVLFSAKTIEASMMTIAWVAISVWMVFLVLQDLYKNCYEK